MKKWKFVEHTQHESSLICLSANRSLASLPQAGLLFLASSQLQWTVVCGQLTIFLKTNLHSQSTCTYIGVMKKLVLVFLFVCTCFLGFAKELESKTFLVLFDEAELELLQTDMGSIAEQLNPFFPTKSYEGNSELALLIEIPTTTFNECLLGEYWISLSDGRRFQLQQLAFRVFDLSENKALYQRYVSKYESDLEQKKKAQKLSKPATTP